jgi:hypothetical protein
MSLPDYMTRRIYTIADAHAFVRALDAEGLFFHLEDDPSDVVGADGLPIFTDDDCMAILQRQAEIWALTNDPCQLAADALGEGEGEDFDEDDDRQTLTKA